MSSLFLKYSDNRSGKGKKKTRTGPKIIVTKSIKKKQTPNLKAQKKLKKYLDDFNNNNRL